MSAPFQPGDVVTCVREDICPRHRHLPEDRPDMVGGLFRVTSYTNLGGWCIGWVTLEGEGDIRWCTGTLRKIENDTGFDFREQIRAKPVRPVLNPSRHSREMV